MRYLNITYVCLCVVLLAACQKEGEKPKIFAWPGDGFSCDDQSSYTDTTGTDTLASALLDKVWYLQMAQQNNVGYINNLWAWCQLPGRYMSVMFRSDGTLVRVNDDILSKENPAFTKEYTTTWKWLDDSSGVCFTKEPQLLDGFYDDTGTRLSNVTFRIALHTHNKLILLGKGKEDPAPVVKVNEDDPECNLYFFIPPASSKP